MTRTRHTLLVLLTIAASFLAGFSLDRYTHRPIEVRLHSKQYPALQTPEEILARLPAYDTLVEAAAHALARAYQCSRTYECGGVIAKRPDGKFVVGPVRSSYQGDSVDIPNVVPAGYALAAQFHTHPCLASSHAIEFFSPEDMSGVTAHRVPAFMAELCTGKIHMFTPGVDSPNSEAISQVPGMYLTRGRIVGQITVDGVSQEPDTGL